MLSQPMRYENQRQTESSPDAKHRRFRQLRRPALFLLGGTATLASDEVSPLALSLGATIKEAGMLSAIFRLEGFGGKEYDQRLSPAEVVSGEIARLRVLSSACAA